MILLAVFLAFVNSSCLSAAGQFTCDDDSGLLLCLRAQDRVNWLIDRTNETLPYLNLNCSHNVIATDWSYQSRYHDNVYYSATNLDNCHTASVLFNSIVKKYFLTNVLPIECEEIEKKANTSGKVGLPTLLFSFILVDLLVLKVSQ